MQQEYLLLEKNEKDSITTYSPEGVKIQLFPLRNENCWTIRFSIEGENEDTSRKLSNIHDFVTSNYHVITLESGCSAYYTKKLYPLVSRFEFFLRKLLYITSINHKDNSATNNISNLESKDFGEIFSMLFVDIDFMTKTKDEIKKTNKDTFSKKEIILLIESFDENTLWDTLLGKEAVPTLRNHFPDVRRYRNDVMHSHLITWNTYKEARNLFDIINSELLDAINNATGQYETASNTSSFNQTLEEALKYQDRFIEMVKILQKTQEQAEQLAHNIYLQMPDWERKVNMLTEQYEKIISGSATLEFVKQYNELTSKIRELSNESSKKELKD